jgi:hypothetical protein
LTRCSSTPSAEIFVKPDGSTQRTRLRSGLSPPLLDQDGLPGAYADGGTRQQVRNDFEIADVTHLDQRRPRRHDNLALLQSAQDDAVHRRLERDRGRPSAATDLQQPRARLLELMLGGAHGESSGLQRALDRLRLPLSGLHLARGDHASRARFLHKLFCAFQL